MDSQNKIDIGTTSSLVDLKAELIRKQRELQLAKDAKGVPKSLTREQENRLKRKAKYKPNKGIDVRIAKDLEEHERTAKTYERAKIVLAAKAKLYEQMQAEALSHDEHSHPILMNSLVNFQEKAIEDYLEKKTALASSIKVEDDDEMVEFIDTLGRTRRCRKSELAKAIAEDEELGRAQQLESAKRIESTTEKLSAAVGASEGDNVVTQGLSNPSGTYSAVPPPTALNLSKTLTEEQVAELKHQKWEEESEKAAAKDAVHYQDVLFDELRTHGVGYYQFATDDAKRAEQILELKKLSAQTRAVREKVAKERSEKQDKLKERLKKVRARKRARLGLPPKESSSEDEGTKTEEKMQRQKESGDEMEEKDADEDLSKNIDDIKNQLLRGKAEMRPWDYGKPGVYGPKPINFDELDAKWLTDRRGDRKSEFAPPSIYSAKSSVRGSASAAGGSRSFNNAPPPSFQDMTGGRKYGNFIRSSDTTPETKIATESQKKADVHEVEESASETRGIDEQGPRQAGDKHFLNLEKRQTKIQFSLNRTQPQKPVPIQDELPTPVPDSVEAERKRGMGREIPPPPTFEYYHGGSTSAQSTSRTSTSQIEESVTAGLRALREQFERKQKP